MMGRVPQAEAHECARDVAQILDRIAAAPNALHLARELIEAFVEQRVDQAAFVAEVVIDGWRRVATALHQAADREALLALLEQQGLGGVEDGAAHLRTLLGAALFEGGRSHRGFYRLKRRET